MMTIVKRQVQADDSLGVYVELTAKRCAQIDESRKALNRFGKKEARTTLAAAVNEVVRMVCPNANVTIKRLRWER